MNKEFDYTIVGCGLYGSVFAREMTDAGYKCLVIDKREHIAGNCYSENIKGINVHMYGPHIFHTDDKSVWDYVNRFSEFNNFTLRVKAKCNGEVFSLPVNLATLQQIFGVTTPEEAKCKLKEVCIPNDNPTNAEEWLYTNVGKEITNLFYRGYTEKHWMKFLNELPVSIIKRLPVRTNFNDNYFNHPYSGIPIGGYTKLFRNLLKGIKVRLETDFFDDIEYYETISKKIIYTGAIDEFFDYKFGRLEYKTIDIEFSTYDVDDYQGCAIMTYPQGDKKYTRSIEHKHFDNTICDKTVVTCEIPVKWDESKIPYYPLNDLKNSSIYENYKECADELPNYIFGGRLAEYKYYDMHQVIKSALITKKREINE